MRPFRSFALAAALIPLSLGLAACQKDGAAPTDGASASAAVKAVPPPAGQVWSDVVSKTADGGFKMGNPDAPLKVIEYGALSCSHCADFSKEAHTDLRETFVNSGKVSYELRLMVNNFLDVPAVMLVNCAPPEAGLALADQFWAWQAKMFETLQAAGDPQLQAAAALPPEKRMVEIARLAGMDQFFAARGLAADQAKACLADQNRATAAVNASEKYGKDNNITGTPTFFLNGASIGTLTWKDLKAKLEQAGAR